MQQHAVIQPPPAAPRLPADFCSDIERAHTLPARCYTADEVFQYEKNRSSPNPGSACATAASWPGPTITSPAG